jgi:hypothetical protein
MRFVFLQMIVATNASMSCPFVTRHLVPADEETGISSLDVTYSLEEASEFVGEACLPNLTVGFGLDEMAIFETSPVMSSMMAPMKLRESEVVVALGVWMILYVFSRRARVAETYP